MKHITSILFLIVSAGLYLSGRPGFHWPRIMPAAQAASVEVIPLSAEETTRLIGLKAAADKAAFAATHAEAIARKADEAKHQAVEAFCKALADSMHMHGGNQSAGSCMEQIVVSGNIRWMADKSMRFLLRSEP